jgi:hypothetical protein
LLSGFAWKYGRRSFERSAGGIRIRGALKAYISNYLWQMRFASIILEVVACVCAAHFPRIFGVPIYRYCVPFSWKAAKQMLS